MVAYSTIPTMVTKQLLVEFGQLLESRHLAVEVTIAGGSALNLLAITDRLTRDVDVVDPAKIPVEIQIAAADFAAEPRRGLDVGWFNAAARVYADPLPAGWEDRAKVALTIPGLTVRTLHRDDLIKLKIYALCVRGKDLQDCLALNPNLQELRATRVWLEKLKRGTDWTKDVEIGFGSLERELMIKRQKGREPEFE